MKKGERKESVLVFEDKDGYLCLRIRNIKDNTIKIHRIIKEYELKRKLKEGEIVHHKNEDKQDNRFKNLEVKEKGEHQREHQLEKGRKSTKQICGKCGGKKSYNRKNCMKCRDKRERTDKGRFL